MSGKPKKRLTRRTRDHVGRPCKVFACDAGDNYIWLVGGKNGQLLSVRTKEGKRLGGIFNKNRLRVLAESIMWMLDGKDASP